MSPKLPSSLQAAYIGALIGSALIGCCAVYSGVGVAAQLYMTQVVGEIAPSGGDPQMAAMLEMQHTMAIVSTIALVLQLATSVSLAVAGGIGMTGRPIARPLLVVAVALVVLGMLVDVGVAIWSWSQMSSGPYGLGGASAEERRMIAMYGALGMLPTLLWMLFKLALCAAAVGGAYSSEAKSFYARMGPEGLVRGPRE